MIRKIRLKLLLTSLFFSFVLTLFPSLIYASHKPTANYDYLIGAGLLCGLPFPDPCPVVSQSSKGEKIEITGLGTFSTNPKSVTGGGTFVHKDAAGNILGSGDWHAMKLTTFRSWGTQADLPNNFEGGVAQIRIHLAPSTGGPGFIGTIKVICAVGDVPTGAEEGTKLWIRGAPNFKEIVSGLTLFIRTN